MDRIHTICLGTTDNLILSCLSAKDLFNFSLTCRTARDSVAAYNSIAYSIRKLLSRYFDEVDIDSFRYLQLKTGTLISGSTALQFFDRTYYTESDLDLYVEYNQALKLIDFITCHGYCFAPRETQNSSLHEAVDAAQYPRAFDDPEYSDLGVDIADVFSFSKDGQIIQVIAAHTSPMDIILAFHSTCVMQVISAQTAFSLYPYATFVSRRSLILPTNPRSDKTVAIDKYTERGWKMIDAAHYEYTDKRAFPTRTRSIGDRHCWTISLPPFSSPIPNFELPSIDTLRINSWTLELQYDDGQDYCSCCRDYEDEEDVPKEKEEYIMKYSPLFHSKLQSRYVSAPEPYMYHAILAQVRRGVSDGVAQESLDENLARHLQLLYIRLLDR